MQCLLAPTNLPTNTRKIPVPGRQDHTNVARCMQHPVYHVRLV